MDGIGNSRRAFLRASGGAMGAAWLTACWPGIAAAAEHAHEMMATDTADRSRFLLLTAAQARDVDAIASQIVPSGATPGAHEAGVVYFVDQIHTGVFKSEAKGFIERLGAFQQACTRHHPGEGAFADLIRENQLSFLKHMEHTPFFGEMRFLTVLGLLANPSYGGNAGKSGWNLVGFVDRHVWESPYGHYDRDYPGFAPYPGTKVQA